MIRTVTIEHEGQVTEKLEQEIEHENNAGH